MGLISRLEADAHGNRPLFLVAAAAGVVAAYAGVQMLRGGSATAAAVAPTPAPAPAPVSSGGTGTVTDTGSGSGTAATTAPGVDMTGLLAALLSANSGGQSAGAGLGGAGMQAGVDLGAAGLSAGTTIGLGGLQLASDATNYLGQSLQVSVGAQAYQTVGVTDSLTGLIDRISGGAAPWWAAITSPPTPAAGQSRTPVAKTTVGAKAIAPRATKPGTVTPAGHILPPPAKVTGPPVTKPPVKLPVVTKPPALSAVSKAKAYAI